MYTVILLSSLYLTLVNIPAYSLGEENIDTHETTFRIEGMTCKVCSLTIKKALINLNGVIDAEVRYNERIATVQLDKSEIDLEDISNTIETLGDYRVTVLSNSKFHTTTIDVGKGPDALFLTPNEKILYVANVEDTFISVIDTKEDKVIKKIDVADYPWGFTRLGNKNLVAVSSWDKGIDIIDFTKHKIVQSKRYEFNLGGIVSTKDGKYIFVVAPDKNKTFKIDVDSLEILDEYKTGDGPDGIGISNDDKKIYTANTKDGTISIINLSNKSGKVIKTGGKPELVHANHDRTKLFISNFYKNHVHVIDTERDVIVRDIIGLDGPEEAVLSKSEKVLYVVNFNGSKVFTFDANSYEKLDEEYATGSKPIGVISVLEDTKLYISNYGDNTITVIKKDSTK